MKKIIKQIGTIVFVAVIGFSIAACSNGGSSGGGSSSGGNNNNNSSNNENNNNSNSSAFSISGDNLTFSGQVYKMNFEFVYEESFITVIKDSFDVYVWSHYDNSKSTVKGKVINGQLKLSIGKPNVNEMESITQMMPFFYGYDLVLSDAGVNIYGFSIEEEYYNLAMNYAYLNMSNYTQGIVSFFYVDKDVNISAKGYTDDYWGIEHSGLNLSLKAGWNAVSEEETYSKETLNLIKRTFSQTVPSRQWMWLLGDY